MSEEWSPEVFVIVAMFTKPLAEIDEKDLQALVNHKEQESAELEFKREIESTDKGKKKLAKHVSAMANANGGIIIFGIEEKDSKADKLIGIDEMVGDQPVGEFVNNVLISRVRPRLAVQPQTVKLANGKVVLVLQVSRIPYRPHMVLAENVYYVRHNCSVALADEHEVRAMVLESKSSSDDVKEFLKKRNLDDKDKENFALTLLAEGMWEVLSILGEVPEGYEGKPFVLFASCPRHLEERIDIASADFASDVYQSSHFDLLDCHVEFLNHARKSTTSDSVRFSKLIYKNGKEIPVASERYVEIFRNGYVERGLCRSILDKDTSPKDLGLLFHISFFVADFWAYMTFISQLYRKIGYFDELNIMIALSNMKGVTAHAFADGKLNAYHTHWHTDIHPPPTAQENNVLIEKPVILSELGSARIEEIVKDVAGRVANHFDQTIDECLDEEGNIDKELLRFYYNKILHYPPLNIA